MTDPTTTTASNEPTTTNINVTAAPEITMPTMPTGAGTDVKVEPINKIGKAEAKLKNKASKSSTTNKTPKAPKAVSNKEQAAKVGKSGKDKGKASKGSIKVPAKTVKSTKVKEPKVAKEKKEPRQPPNKAFPHHDKNPYRMGSNYSLAWNILVVMGLKKPVSRKDLLDAYIKAGKRGPKNASFDWAVVLSPTEAGKSHKSARGDHYWVERKENHMVQLHMT